MSQPRATKIIITLFIITFSTLTVPNMLNQNLIGDEAVYITEGDRYLHEPYSFYYNSGSPHLLKSLSALFYCTLPLNRNYQPYYNQNHTNVYTVAQFIYDQNTPYARQIIIRARIPHLIISLILGIFLFLFTQKYIQTKTATIALAFYTFHPSILAHAATANLDLGATAFIFFALITYFYTIQKYNQKQNTNEQTTMLQNNTPSTKRQCNKKTEKNYCACAMKTIKNLYARMIRSKNTKTKIQKMQHHPLLNPSIVPGTQPRTENSTNSIIGEKPPHNNKLCKSSKNKFITANMPAETPPAIPDTSPENSKKNHQSNTAHWIVCTGILLGVAQLTKISAILLYPFIFITSAIYLKKNKITIPLTITIISIATIITCYGVQTGPIITHHDDPAGVESLYGSIPLINQYKNTITNVLRMPIFPAGAYINNFTYQFTHSFYGHTIYLNGIFTDQGLWYFIPVLFLYKNSIILLIALAIALVAFFKRKRYKNTLITYLTIWCIIMALWSVTSKLQLGIRYILPLFPALFIIIADALTHKTKSALKLSIIITLYALSTLTIYPNYFTYTQELIRFQNPLKLIADSDYDWGQSVYKLGHVQKQKNLYPLYFTQSGGASQAYYEIQNENNAETAFTEKKSGYYAFSHTALIGFKKNNPALFNYFITQKPYSTIDNSIYVYKITF